MKTTLFDQWRDTPSSDQDPETIETAQRIFEDVRTRGAASLREYGEKFDRLGDAALIADHDELRDAWSNLPDEARGPLQRSAERVRAFAEAQREALQPLHIDLGGFRVGHHVLPVSAAGCYVPGGRYPLISSALMTVIPAAVAGVEEITVCSPSPGAIMLAVAHLAGAKRVLRLGGAQGIAALALGIDVPRCDVIVGPGNRFVVAAKRIAQAQCRIDMAAGATELCVVADEHANPEYVASDILAQAEHDPDARPVLVTLSEPFAKKALAAVERQLAILPTREIAEQSLANRGEIVLVETLEQATEIVNRLAPEHLQVMIDDEEACQQFVNSVRNAGGIFIGSESAEVFGDYASGPNHTLPTGGWATRRGGLAVYDFLKVVTFQRSGDQPVDVRQIEDAAWLAEQEGLIGHARAARQRLG
ncbi:Histidinol dehydrogenase [Planctomycetes bacterium Pan216]|uniref:Histidinol dehydrogenase n=1 Tax=Kolteria novifilia TaxID=2527975 RepID=A0A518B3H9_9BACT|nr:Histidinol dehydrogenase [Planctomycetes bacterium Pan216]